MVAMDVIFGTDTAVADSSKEHPLELTLQSTGGHPITVKVTDTIKTDTDSANARKIRHAIKAQNGFHAYHADNS